MPQYCGDNNIVEVVREWVLVEWWIFKFNSTLMLGNVDEIWDSSSINQHFSFDIRGFHKHNTFNIQHTIVDFEHI